MEGPVVRVSPTLLVVNDPTRLPDIYHRQADKSNFYVNGISGKIENVFSTRDWREHAHLRKFIAGPVSEVSLRGLALASWVLLHSQSSMNYGDLERACGHRSQC